MDRRTDKGQCNAQELAKISTSRHQVYGFAPTRIIYLIATRFILGFDSSLQPEQSNFRQVDTVPYAKEGRMEELIKKELGI